MLAFNEQYNVLHGIYITFSQNSKRRLLVSKHKWDTREKYQVMYPYKRYETWTKENMVLLGLMIMLDKRPSSFNGMISHLIEDDIDDKVKRFKDIIMNYKSYIVEDVNLIVERYGEKVSVDTMFKLYTDKSIKFYTLWWYLVYSGADIDTLCKHRIKGSTIRAIKQMNLFLTFKESNLDKVKETLIEKLDLNTDL